jgi:phenylalanyl-tRNA synthetase alpha chain
MLEKIESVKKELAQADLSTAQELENFRLRFLAKKGHIAQLFDQLNQIPTSEKKSVGGALNTLKQQAQAIYSQAKEKLAAPSLAQSSSHNEEDYTLPPPDNLLGTLHPISLLKLKIIDFFEKIGFSLAEGPEIEDDWHNFGALNFAPGHPARDMLDTFFIANQSDRLLRTHTSSVQIRIAESQLPPIRAISVGRVYRNETISARSHCMFHQLDGIYINQSVTFADLKQLLAHFMRILFGSDAQIRLRPSYFPFTVLSAEIDVNCSVCKGEGCTLCKHTGWLEIMGAGMVHPRVFQNCHIDPEQYSGYAFGMGLERVAMLQYGINDLRLFTENDIRFLKQFKSFP